MAWIRANSPSSSVSAKLGRTALISASDSRAETWWRGWQRRNRLIDLPHEKMSARRGERKSGMDEEEEDDDDDEEGVEEEDWVRTKPLVQ